ncbi:2-dehydropantoate 2-reductase [Rhodoblastus acidophilus]|uniref:2-dehydropantoate 2-reductase n=1 Tax=Rhodoblastus acidophilus TaxID=1074 RepID=A0A6N8DHG7_RHOAC|nr:2-dehydropantoate 2-reductase [Rhodoblastus acidophilus]MCW2272830.1 2-dehydropantoate 2-reductase [Rhodoblastus acidophilus]MTV29739.1 2-dehydropantoate 2-reductase [Rhodoblastus acidophilus]
MRILVVGAGALGGYFGGRLAQAGRDVTFLLRPRRAALLQRNGLSILSPCGDFHLAKPRIVTAEQLKDPFDLILLSCKAYDLEDAMAAFAAGVGSKTAILPMLNGMSHLDALAARFGADTCLGGLCQISAGLDGEGRIQHFNDLHSLVFGELDGAPSARMAAIASALTNAGFEAQPCEKIRQEMWEKWIFIAALAGITCLMRAAVGDIVAAGGADLALALFDENAAIAAANGFAPRPASVERSKGILTAKGSPIKASMLRDIEANNPIEGEHIFGDLLRRAQGPSSLLRIADLHARAYEAQRARVSA